MKTADICLACAVFLVLSAVSRCSSASYSILNLGVLGEGSWSTAVDINDAGQVAGSSQYYAGGGSHAFIWSSESGMTDIGSLSGRGMSQAHAINNYGTVVGKAYAFGEGGYSSGFVWNSHAGIKPLSPLPGDGMTAAMAVSDNGIVAGQSLAGNLSRACIWNAEGISAALPALVATAINNTGDVAGTYSSVTSHTRSFLLSSVGEFLDIGTLGGPSSVAYAINNYGAVVGESSASDSATRAYLWTRDDGMTPLGTLGGRTSVAYDINNIGQAVGKSTNGDGRSRPFIWSQLTGMEELPLLPRALTGAAYGINQAGQVVGESGGYAVLWTPVPEPSPLASLLGASGWLVVGARRRTYPKV